MTERTYYAPHGGMPRQTDLMTDREVFTEAYAGHGAAEVPRP